LSRSEAEKIVRVGVIGLGRAWSERYRSPMTRPGLAARVVAVCDPVLHRSETEADRLRCDAVEGVTALIDRPDVDAVFLLDDPWFGAWPIQVAMDRDKPVFSTVGARETLDELGRWPDGRAPAMIELPRRFSPETLRLRELLATELGPPRRVRARIQVPRETGDLRPADAAIELLDWCRSLFQATPSSCRPVLEIERGGLGLRVVELEFPGGGSARLTLRTGNEIIPTTAGLTVEADRGRARIDSRDRLRWSNGGEMVEERLSSGPPTALMIDHFLRLVRGEQSLAPGPDELVLLDTLANAFSL
jgi:predicted dehydrogenase